MHSSCSSSRRLCSMRALQVTFILLPDAFQLLMLSVGMFMYLDSKRFLLIVFCCLLLYFVYVYVFVLFLSFAFIIGLLGCWISAQIYKELNLFITWDLYWYFSSHNRQVITDFRKFLGYNENKNNYEYKFWIYTSTVIFREQDTGI
jgi:hypothetical protein